MCCWSLHTTTICDAILVAMPSTSKPADIASMYPRTYVMPKECLECHYYLYIHIGVMYTGFFMEGTAAKMASKLNRSMLRLFSTSYVRGAVVKQSAVYYIYGACDHNRWTFWPCLTSSGLIPAIVIILCGFWHVYSPNSTFLFSFRFWNTWT